MKLKDIKTLTQGLKKSIYFLKIKNEPNEEINKTVKEVTLASLSEIELEKIIKNNCQTIEIKLSYKRIT